jgi:tetratricopeptide (TPR) repeat protein
MTLCHVRTFGYVLALGVIAAPLAGQTLPLKRTPPAATAAACPVFPPPPAPVREQIDEANRLGTLAREAALEGDHKAARDLFKQAAQLNRADPNLAYRLGRESEELGDSTAAVHEYCRYLSIAPATAGEAPGVRDRLSTLLAPAVAAQGTTLVTQFQSGVKAYDAGDWDGATGAFSAVVQGAPGYAPAYFDRALVRARQHHQGDAIRDFNSYLRLAPGADDRDVVRERIDGLRHEMPSAGTAFALGLFPGGGQYYTGQYVLGVLVTGAAAGGVALALTSQTVTKLHHFVDVNGVPYTQPFQATEHQNLGAGLAIAGGATLFGAIEAALVAHHRSAQLPPPDSTLTAAAFSRRPALALQLPTVVPTTDGTGVRIGMPIRVTF